MSQVALTELDRVRAIQAFGYTERESQFLVTAALNGGYFVRRQFCLFLGKASVEIQFCDPRLPSFPDDVQCE